METEHDKTTLDAINRVKRARTELVQSRRFYGALVAQVDPIPSRQFPTMATNGKVHFFNPEFITGLTQNKVLGVQAHESEHDARRHHTRRGGRDPFKWNEATDYEINVDLVDEGFELPEGALIDEKYRGMSAEDIYRSREIDEALRQKAEQDAAEKDESDDESDESDEGDDTGSDEGEGDDEAGDEAGDDDADADEDGDDGDSAGGDEDANEGQGDDGEGGNADDGDTEGQPGGQGQGEGEGDEAGEGSGEGSAEAGDDADGDASGSGANDDAAEGGKPSAKSSGDPGGCGEVLDAADNAADIADESCRWERVVKQAARMAAKRGDLPGHVAREIERASHAPQDWREVLRAYFDGGATTQETWNRPNKRFAAGGIYLPGRMKDGVNRVVFMIDTSGSVTYYPGALEAIQVETQAALDENIIDEVVILYGDTRVTRVDTYKPGDEMVFDPRGGGGTYMRPLFDYVNNEIDDPSLIVAFTDLEIEPESMLGPQPACPVLWAVVGYPENVKKYLAATPWGEPGIEVRPE